MDENNNVVVRVGDQEFVRGEDGYSPVVTVEEIEHGHSVNITDREHPEGQSFDVLDGASAYEQAVAGGYTGTEAQFNQELQSFKTLSEQAAGSATQAAGSASAAAGSASAAAGSASAAAGSETAAAGSASAAAGAASAAAGSASAAEQSAIDAAAAAEATGGSETAAAASATAAAASATAAADSATAAEEHEYDAEAWADGERNGSPVGSADKTYHNNAKYYAQQAGASATAAGQSVDAAAASATAAADSATAAASAKTAAEAAQTAAVAAKTATETARDTAVSTLQTEGAAQRTAIQQKGQEVLESIPEDYTDLSDDVDDLKSAVDQKAPAIYDTASGAVASFEDGADGMPLKQVVVDIEPVQAGSGDPSPTNVRPISGWTGCNVTRGGSNLLDPDIIEFGAYSQYASPSLNGDNRYRRLAIALPAGDFVFHTDLNNGYIVRAFIDDTPSGTEVDFRTFAFSLSKPGVLKITFRNLDTTAITEPFNSQINIGTTLANYEPYQGNTYPITFPTEVGPVYGGRLDATNKMLYVNYEYVDLGQCIPSSGIVFDDAELGIIRFPSASKFPHLPLRGGYTYCSIFKGTTVVNAYNWDDNTLGFTNAQWNLFFRIRSSLYVGKTPAEVADMLQGVYAAVPLFEPIEISLSDVPNITTLLGTNNIWADCGDVMVEYPADTKLYIQKINAPTDDDMTADTQIDSGKYFLIGNTLYLSTTVIPAGDTIIPGTNCTKTNLAAALNALNT